jgi:hypothetical protein
MLTLAAAAAGFVIVFQFLALQLQAGNDPAVGGALTPTAHGSHVAAAPATSGSSPVVTRASGGVQTMPVSGAQTAPATGSPQHSRTHHSVLTSASGSGHGHSDDLD